MKKMFQRKKMAAYWKALKPWLLFIAVLVLLRYTGVLAGLSSLTNRAMLQTSVLDADPAATPDTEVFDYNFSINTLSGEKVNFEDYRGKTVFLNLWATWCGPCRAEMPSIHKLYQKTDKSTVVFVMLSLDTPDQLKKVQHYVKSNEFDFPVFMAGQLPQQLQVPVIPTTFIISPEGAIAYKKAGMANYNTPKFRQFLEDLTGTPE